jgi:hypothetical protein
MNFLSGVFTVDISGHHKNFTGIAGLVVMATI